MGLMYERGEGVPQDYKEAAKWFRFYAELGMGIPQVYKEPRKWYRFLEEHGMAYREYNLGLMYEQGKGVPQDYKEAANHYNFSALIANDMMGEE